MSNRRDFLKVGALAGAGALMAKVGTKKAVAAAPVKVGTPKIKPFLDPLIAAIPVLTPDTLTYPGVDYYVITMSVGSHLFHTQLLGPAATLRSAANPARRRATCTRSGMASD